MTNFKEVYNSAKPKFLEVAMGIGAAAVIAGGIDMLAGNVEQGSEIAGAALFGEGVAIVDWSNSKVRGNTIAAAIAEHEASIAEVIELPHDGPIVPAPEAEIA